MTRTTRPARAIVVARVAVVAGIGGFWVFASVAAAQEPGYDPTSDYLSSLAAVGAAEPAWGLAMFGSATIAVAGAAWCARSPLLLAAAASLLLSGVFRVDCPGGAAGCNAGPLVVEPALSGQVHAAAVAGYQILLSAALAHLAWRARQAGRTAAVVAGVAGAVLPLLLAFNPLPLDPGVSQRLWVASGQAVLLMVAFWPQRPATVGE